VTTHLLADTVIGTVFSSYLAGLNIMTWRSIFRKLKRWSWDLLLWSQISLPIQSSIGSIEQVSSVKLLGLHLDANFSWRSHVEAMLSEATKRLYFLKLLKRAGVPCVQLQHFYVTVIRPILEYAAPVWHHLLMNCQSDQTEAIQKRAINIIHSPSHGMPYSKALFFAGLTSLRARREQVARKFL